MIQWVKAFAAESNNVNSRSVIHMMKGETSTCIHTSVCAYTQRHQQ